LNKKIFTETPSGWHLTPQQIAQFDQQGYLLLPQRLQSDALQKLRVHADLIHEQAHIVLKKTASRQKKMTTDFAFSDSYFQSYLNRLLHFHLYAGYESLFILGCPQLLAAVESLCGTDFLPTVDMMIFKQRGNEKDISWHQDLIYQTDCYRVIAAGIYLENSESGEDALCVIPGSQHARHDICEIIKKPPDTIIDIAVNAGDILIHNPMIIHSSKRLSSQNWRRTLYYEFRPLQQLLNEESWPDKLINRRFNLLATSLREYHKQNLQAEEFQWHFNNPKFQPQIIDSLRSVYLDPIPFNTANFCADISAYK
jgi:ectoine hydroxylase-related dioxygenase (phytanoyl-CoA dioxygenase family)